MIASNNYLNSLWILRICMISIFILNFYVTEIKSETLRHTIHEYVNYLKSNEIIEKDNQLIIAPIVNFYTNQNDDMGQQIEGELFEVFSQDFSEIKLIDISESIAGVSLKESFLLKGSYKQKAKIIELQLKLIKDSINGEVVTQRILKYQIQGSLKKDLVAVLEIDSNFMTAEKKKAYTDYLRYSAHINYPAFTQIN